MQGNSISKNQLSQSAVTWVVQLQQQLQLKFKGKGTIRNYCQEVTLLFKYYHTKPVENISQADIRQYMPSVE
jgi:hypothetical protein